jgi:hypothetical protein
MIRPIEKYIGQNIVFYCPYDGEELGWEHEYGGGMAKSSCEHFEWHEISTLCYYNEVPGCGLSYVRQIKQKAVLKIFGGTTMYLLVPKSQ